MRKEVYLPAQPVTSDPKHHFFGFNDLCPWDISGKFMLALEVDFIDRLPGSEDKTTVGLIDLADGNRFHPLGETRAWNFEQGARLQWIPGKSNEIVFNERDGSHLKSVIVDITNGKCRTLPLPVYALSPDGHFALTPNFARLWRLGGYGYLGVTDACQEDPTPEDDGIYRMDLETGKHELIISIAEVVSLGNVASTAKNEHHYLTHILFNPDGTRICFLHRWSLKDGGIYTRLMTANPDGSDLYCLAEGRLSHFDWRNSKEILIWGRYRPRISWIRQRNLFVLPIFRQILALVRWGKRGLLRQHFLGDRYLLFTDQTQDVKAVGVNILTEDGHCSYSPDRKWILTDTYPDEKHYHTLILYHLETNRRIDIGRFYSLPDPSKYVGNKDWDISGMRSDLHPRWNKDGTQVCFDSVHEGERQMYVIDVTDIVKI